MMANGEYDLGIYDQTDPNNPIFDFGINDANGGYLSGSESGSGFDLSGVADFFNGFGSALSKTNWAGVWSPNQRVTPNTTNKTLIYLAIGAGLILLAVSLRK